MDLNKFLDHSGKIQTDDIDWDLGKKSGLTEDEVFVLTYFSDIESQTIIYMRDLLHTTAIQDPDTIGFLSMWNYEEYFHGQVLGRLLAVCGKSLGEQRISEVRRQASFSERLNAMGGSLLSRIFSREFPALYMIWGAINELTTLRGYESIYDKTTNPILKILCERIAKQERKHYAWYYNSAQGRLAGSSVGQKLTHRVLAHFWSPVGVGVKTWEEAKGPWVYPFLGVGLLASFKEVMH